MDVDCIHGFRLEVVMWFPAKGFEGRVEVTRCGRVRSIDRYVDNYPSGKRMIRGKEISCSKSLGYKVVDLRKRDSRGQLNSGRVISLHRLIAMTFIPNPLNLPEVNHIDGNKINNSVDNLEWCTNLENVRHAIRTGLTRQNKPVIKISSDVGVWYPSMRSAIQDGCNPSLIHAAIHGRQSVHRGCRWDYCEIYKPEDPR